MRASASFSGYSIGNVGSEATASKPGKQSSKQHYTKDFNPAWDNFVISSISGSRTIQWNCIHCTDPLWICIQISGSRTIQVPSLENNRRHDGTVAWKWFQSWFEMSPPHCPTRPSMPQPAPLTQCSSEQIYFSFAHKSLSEAICQNNWCCPVYQKVFLSNGPIACPIVNWQFCWH